MPPTRSSASRAPVLVGWAVALVSFAYLLALPPTLNGADESIVLYGAKRVWQGDALYRDFFEFQTPGSFYLYALAYAIGGVSITTARVTTALVNALAAACTYGLALRVASVGEAAVAGLLVTAVCVPVWNMASHNWIATACGLAAAAVLVALRWRASSRLRPAAAGALVGLLGCTQASRGVGIAAWLAVAVPALAITRGGDTRRAVREVLWAAGGGVAVCVGIMGWAAWRSSVPELVYATYTWVMTNYRPYNVGFITWGGAGVWWAAGLAYTWPWLLNAIPALLVAEILWVAVDCRRLGVRSQAERAVLLLLAGAAVAGILYFPDYTHVAFIAPFAFVVVAGMVHRLRRARCIAARPGVRRAVGAVGVGLLAVVVSKAATNARVAWRDEPVSIRTAFGTLRTRPLPQQIFEELRARLSPDVDGPPRLLVYPMEPWLYLALPADNPTRYSLLRPVYNTPRQIAEAIADLERDPRARVLVSNLLIKPGDPLVAHLERYWRETAQLGPPLAPGIPFYRLFERPAPG